MSKDLLTREFQPETIDQPRRRFFGTAAMTIAAAQLGMIASAAAQTGNAASKVPAIKPGTNTSFKSLRQINAGLLNVGYVEEGPSDGPPVLLLHGWPYDIHSYVDVAPLLASKGYRVIVPYLRGYGTTRFLASGTFRNGQQSGHRIAPQLRGMAFVAFGLAYQFSLRPSSEPAFIARLRMRLKRRTPARKSSSRRIGT